MNGNSAAPLEQATDQNQRQGNQTMKAVMWEGHTGEMIVRQVPKPFVQKPSQVLIRITTAASMYMMDTYPHTLSQKLTIEQQSVAPIYTHIMALLAEMTFLISWVTKPWEL